MSRHLAEFERRIGRPLDAKWDAINVRLGQWSWLIGIACIAAGFVLGRLAG